jgi:hypothetical protein
MSFDQTVRSLCGEVRGVNEGWFREVGVLGAASAFHVWKEGGNWGWYARNCLWDLGGVCKSGKLCGGGLRDFEGEAVMYGYGLFF